LYHYSLSRSASIFVARTAAPERRFLLRGRCVEKPSICAALRRDCRPPSWCQARVRDNARVSAARKSVPKNVSLSGGCQGVTYRSFFGVPRKRLRYRDIRCDDRMVGKSRLPTAIRFARPAKTVVMGHSIVANLAAQSSFGISPKAVRGGARHAQRIGRLVDRQAGKVPRLDNLRCLGFWAANGVRAASKARSTSLVAAETNSYSSSGTRFNSPPCFTRPFRHEFSTTIRRMASAAAAKKCPRPSHSCASVLDDPTNRSYASCTSAVASSVWPGSSAAIFRAAEVRNCS
jgi:hypothetical protein